ncbi:uncharacterized protein LOC131291007 [Anopheles ziemanni]|uniref:uncharacterized protein LOC131269030 n=1 Tax=Anopheles coustani TaxID=139045 RepID=UPI002658AA27|nr:uncharacterized protein LOC131269030 [Anopheles coustani]XP_058176182.1 uncharacterized protein LOC131291007 [Anopheles ziemanni]
MFLGELVTVQSQKVTDCPVIQDTRPAAFMWFAWALVCVPVVHALTPTPAVVSPRRSPLSDVIGIILHTHFQQPYTTTLVIVRSQTEDGRRSLQDLVSLLLLDYVRGQLMIQFEGAPVTNQSWQRPWSHILLLAEDYEALRLVYGQLTLNRYDFAGYYLIVLIGTDTTLATIDRIFNDLWQRQIVNVIVAFRVPPAPNFVQLWTYFPYSPGLCRVPKPHLVLTWPNDTLLYGVNFFPRKNANFHGCPLKVGTFETRPFTILTGTPGPGLGLSGFEGDLLASVATKLRFSVNLRIPPHSQQWGVAAFENSTGMMRMIYSEEVDFGIGCLGVSSERNAMLKPGKVHFTTELVIVVPPGRPYTPIEKLIQPYSPLLWGAIVSYFGLGMLTIITSQRMPVLRRYLIGRGVQAPSLNMLRLLFGNPLPHTPTGTFPRTLLLLWVQLCFVLQIVYQGSLFTFLQRASRHPPMATLADIERSGAHYHITESARRFFEPFPQQLGRLRYFPPGPDSIATRLRWVGAHPDDPDVTMCTQDHVAYYNRANRRRLWIAREPLALYTVTVLYPKKSMLTTSFDEHIERIESSGLLKFWVARYGDYHFFERRSRSARANTPAPISIGQLRGAFQLLLCLLATSGVVLLGELFWIRKTAHHISQTNTLTYP